MNNTGLASGVPFGSKARMIAMTALLSSTLFAAPALAQGTLDVISYGDLRILDPYKGTGNSTYHAQMIYDTLLNVDPDNVPQPQMVDEWSISDDGLEYTFTLREGLLFTDGLPVTSEDVIASAKRWNALAATGQSSPIDPEGYEAIDDTTFVIRLERPYPLFLHAIGSTFAPLYVMRAEDLDIALDENVTTSVGSGPFIFESENWSPGARVMYRKNEDYTPRSEPANGFAGGRNVYVDEVVWHNIPDSQTALSALETGEVVFIESVEGEELARGREIENVAEAGSSSRGQSHMMVINHTVPPFDTVEGRQAMLHLINPHDVLLGALGNEDLFETCGSFYICGSQYAKPAGLDGLSAEPDLDRAQELLDLAGYDGEPITILMATDRPQNFNASQVFAYQLEQLDTLNVESAIMDWGALTTRRASRELPADGGWSMFYTTGYTTSQSDPAFHFNARMMCDDGWFGWACDPEIEQMRTSWADIEDEDERALAAQALQERWAQALPFIPLGAVSNRSIYRADRIEGVLDTPIRTPLWNISLID